MPPPSASIPPLDSFVLDSRPDQMAEITARPTDGSGSASANSQKWRRRWEADVPWIAALLKVADLACVDQYWKDDNPHGKKVAVETPLREKLLDTAPNHESDMPSGRALLNRVEMASRTYRAGEARRDLMNDSQWQAALKQQVEDPPLRKGVAGFKAWSEIREYLRLLGWADVELEDSDQRCLSEAQQDLVAEYKPILEQVDEALQSCEGKKAARKEEKEAASKAEARREAHDFPPSFPTFPLSHSARLSTF